MQTYNEIVNGWLNNHNVVANVYMKHKNIDNNADARQLMSDFGFNFIKKDKHYKIYSQKFTKRRYNRLMDALKDKPYYIKFNRVDGYEDDIPMNVRFNRIMGLPEDAPVSKEQILEYLNTH